MFHIRCKSFLQCGPPPNAKRGNKPPPKDGWCEHNTVSLLSFMFVFHLRFAISLKPSLVMQGVLGRCFRPDVGPSIPSWRKGRLDLWSFLNCSCWALEAFLWPGLGFLQEKSSYSSGRQISDKRDSNSNSYGDRSDHGVRRRRRNNHNFCNLWRWAGSWERVWNMV